MNHIKRFLGAVAPALVMILSTTPAAALSLKEFQKFSEQERVHFVSAAVSMTAYIHAANGETAKAHCIAKWYFGGELVEIDAPVVIPTPTTRTCTSWSTALTAFMAAC